jgi:hypothetical protein
MAAPRRRIVCLAAAALTVLGMASMNHAAPPHPHTGAPSIVPASYQAAAPAKACDMGFVPVKPTEGVGSIIGTAWAQCDVAPRSHVLTIRLEMRPRGGSWTTIASAPPDSKIPPGPPLRASYLVKTPCQPGLWRVAAEAHGVGPTGIPFRSTDYSVPAITSCSRGK